MTPEKTAVALRVLMAINNRQHPEERDVLLLRAYCPEHPNMPADDLACLVIQDAFNHKLDRILNAKTFGAGRKGASA